MILVTVGTTHFPFDRLMASVAQLSVSDRIVVQRGASRVPVPNAEVVDFFSFQELSDRIRQSRLVVCHAGVGSIMVALANGRRPIVVPRLARYGEAVDDHQTQLATMLAERDTVTVTEPAQLRQIVTLTDPVAPAEGLAFGPLVGVVADEVIRAIR